MIYSVLLIGVLSGWSAWNIVDFISDQQMRFYIRKILRPLNVSQRQPVRLIFHPRVDVNLFADFLDLMALGLSAGLTLEKSWLIALQSLPTSYLKTCLQMFPDSISLGCSYEESIKRVAGRIKQDDASMIFSLINQSLKRGTVLNESLMDQAQSLRRQQFAALEKRAQTAGLKILFPIFVFILPTVFLILLAPLAIQLSQGASLF